MTLKSMCITGGLAAAVSILASAGIATAADMPGDGKTIKLARASWDTGWFQAALYQKAFEALGYEVEGPTTLDNPPFYQAVGQGDVDVWVNGWFPLHNDYKDDFEPGAKVIGYVAEGGALQGYLIDKKTADEHGITNLEDFKNDEVKKLFDSNGDGKAELVACPPGWGCEKVIAHHLDAYDLRDHVEPIKAAYSASMADAIGRYKNGESIFFYTWTPNWTVGVLKPNEDVVWIEVPRPDLPADQKELEDKTIIEGVLGCVDNPCEMGWPANDIRPVANVAFLEENPAVAKLLEVMSVPLEDIFVQNARMNAGADDPEDLVQDAELWIANNKDQFDAWIKEAAAATN